jgi:hypothetical protein
LWKTLEQFPVSAARRALMGCTEEPIPMNENQTGAPDATTAPVAASRRRFLGKGAVAAPAVLTLASSPALATGMACSSPSRAMSQHASAAGRGDSGICNGISPGNYKAQTTAGKPGYYWPASCGPDVKMHPLFSGSRFGSMSLKQVLNLVGAPDAQQVAFHLIGAYLNCLNGRIPTKVLTAAQVKAIYTSWDTTGGYPPFVGATPWTGTEIVTYLKNSKISP